VTSVTRQTPAANRVLTEIVRARRTGLDSYYPHQSVRWLAGMDGLGQSWTVLDSRLPELVKETADLRLSYGPD